MHDAIRRYEPDALYLGDRYQSFYYPEVALAAGKHVDVISTNLNASWNDGTFLNAYLDTLHRLTGKPLIISEFYMAAAQNGTGNKNSVGGFPAVTTQRQRRDALTNTLGNLARLPYVVGADWFQYYDEPPHGREDDGEDCNFGLVDIHDHPYDDVASAFAAAKPSLIKATAFPKIRDATAGVPPAAADPFADFRRLMAIKNWDRKRGFIPPDTENPLGDLYICWTPKAMYLAAYVMDIAEPDYYKNAEIPDIDRAAWTIRVNDHPILTARVGAGKKPTISDPALRVESISGTYQEVRCVNAVALPADRFGREILRAGDGIELESTFETFAHANTMKWHGKFVLSDR
jgi:hypothetical protein